MLGSEAASEALMADAGGAGGREEGEGLPLEALAKRPRPRSTITRASALAEDWDLGLISLPFLAHLFRPSFKNSVPPQVIIPPALGTPISLPMFTLFSLGMPFPRVPPPYTILQFPVL